MLINMFAKDEYLGKKGGSGIPQFIISKMPKHDIYIEAFLGTGVIMAKKKKAKVNIGIDKDISILQKTNFTDEYQILHGDSIIFIKYLIEKYIYDGTVLVYLDPPYLPETRTFFKNCKYKHELVLDRHIQLLDICTKLSMLHDNLHFMISGYASQLYTTMLEHRHNWKHFETKTMSRGGVKTEHLWTSFNPDEYLKHDLNYVGHNFTDRQRIKRKAKRWLNNLENMALDEKTLLLELIHHRYKNLFNQVSNKAAYIDNIDNGALKSLLSIGDERQK